MKKNIKLFFISCILFLLSSTLMQPITKAIRYDFCLENNSLNICFQNPDKINQQRSEIRRILNVVSTNGWNVQNVNLTSDENACKKLDKDAFNPKAVRSKCVKDILNNIVNITISDGITFIDDYAFSNLANLRNISLPSKMITLGNGAFCNCPNLTLTEIPFYFTQYGQFCGENVFKGCPNLKIKMPKNSACLQSKMGCCKAQIEYYDYILTESNRGHLIDLIVKADDQHKLTYAYNHLSLLDLSYLDSQDIKNISDFVEKIGVSQRMRERLCRGRDMSIIASVKRLFDQTFSLSQGLVVYRGIKDEFLDYLLGYNEITDRRLVPDNVCRLINTTYLDLGFTSTSLNLNCANCYGNNLMRICLNPGNKAVALNTSSIQSEILLDSEIEFKILNIQPRYSEEQSENIVGYILDVQLV